MSQQDEQYQAVQAQIGVLLDKAATRSGTGIAGLGYSLLAAAMQSHQKHWYQLRQDARENLLAVLQSRIESEKRK